MDRLLLVISTFCFLFGFAYTMHALGARVYRHSRFNFFTILTGFLFQTAFLYARGQQIGRCPLTNLFEVFIFLSWSMVLLYLLIGPTYRLSLLGAFTSVESVFYHLPPIRDLAVANRRLVLTGFGLLTVGLLAGFAMGNVQAHLVKITWSVGVWLLYGLILLAVFRHKVSGHRVAWLSVVAFSAVLCTLWGLNFISETAGH